MEKKIRRYYPRNDNGRRPYPLSVMLRVYCMQLNKHLSEVGLTLKEGPIVDATIISPHHQPKTKKGSVMRK